MARLYLGTQGWSYKDWVGTFYPSGTGARDYLARYATVFDAVELDTTFYATPPASRVDGWYAATPPEFQFTAKVPRAITHDARLVGCGDEMMEFLDVMGRLGPKLGAVLIQLPPDFTTDERSAVQPFLNELPRDYRFAVEFRHRSWLTDETTSMLEGLGMAWTCIDLSYMPRQVAVTAPFMYVRWLGDRRQIQQMDRVQIDRISDLNAWSERLRDEARRVDRIYGFVNNHFSGHSPADVRYLRKSLGLPETVTRQPDELRQGSLL